MLEVFARSGVRGFHTLDALNAIEFFMKCVLKRDTITVFLAQTLTSSNFCEVKSHNSVMLTTLVFQITTVQNTSLH